MKTIKLILTTLLFLASFAAEAQNVVIYKDGNIVKEYTAEQVDSVVYVPAKEVKYYYYVGTEKPTTDSDIETNGIEVPLESPIATLSIENNINYQYFAWPKEWGDSPTFTDTRNNLPLSFGKVASLTEAFDSNENSKYNCRRIGKSAGTTILIVNW